MRKRMRAVFGLVAAISVALAQPNVPQVYAADIAASIRLNQVEGTVSVKNSSEKSLKLLEKMKLYNGYRVNTEQESYAWINLDDLKLNKMDAVSEISIRKRGKKQEILLNSGTLFFDVAAPLEEDESMCIRTSTLAIGIRGTSGWVEVVDEKTSRVCILEGQVAVTAADPVSGG